MLRLYFALIVLVSALLTATVLRNAIWQEPVRLWSDTVAKSPKKFRPNYELGLAFTEHGEIWQGYFYLSRAQWLDTSLFQKPLSRADMYLRKGMFDAAIREYQLNLTKSPNRPDLLNGLGIAYYQKGLFQEALQAFVQVTRLHPDYSAAHSNLGFVYFKLGFSDKAISELQSAIKLDPSDPEPYAKLGFVYANTGRVEEAIELLQKALSLDPKNKTAQEYLKQVLSTSTSSQPKFSN